MYTPPVYNAPQQTQPPPTQIQHTPTPPVQIQQLVTPPDAIPTRAVARSASDLPPELSPMQPSTKKNPQNRIIPIEEDMRRIFNECEDAHNSARLLSDFLAFASPADVEGDVDGVVRVSHSFPDFAPLLHLTVSVCDRSFTRNASLPKSESSPRFRGQPPLRKNLAMSSKTRSFLLSPSRTSLHDPH
jgi:hypothetical protein